MAHARTLFIKDPDARLDYVVNWALWLTASGGDTLASVAWVIPAGITKTADSATTTSATVWISGGTLNTTYTIVCRITTSAGRIEDHSFDLRIQQK